MTYQGEQVVNGLYRLRPKETITSLLDGWEPLMSVEMQSDTSRSRRPAGAPASPRAPRIWLNLEPAKKPPQCLEYLVVHELAHLIEPSHNDRFVAVMDRHLPLWRLHRDALNAEPLAHGTWDY